MRRQVRLASLNVMCLVPENSGPPTSWVRHRSRSWYSARETQGTC